MCVALNGSWVMRRVGRYNGYAANFSVISDKDYYTFLRGGEVKFSSVHVWVVIERLGPCPYEITGCVDSELRVHYY
jgi:hypothetical protein